MQRHIRQLAERACKQISNVSTTDMLLAGFTLRNAYIEERDAALKLIKNEPDVENKITTLLTRLDDLSALKDVFPSTEYLGAVVFVLMIIAKKLGFKPHDLFKYSC